MRALCSLKLLSVVRSYWGTPAKLLTFFSLGDVRLNKGTSFPTSASELLDIPPHSVPTHFSNIQFL